MSNPTTAVFALVDDLDGESQSGAIALTGVDPIRFDDGLWLEEGTTNYWPNPYALVDTAGITSDLGTEGTLTRYVDGDDTYFRLQRTGEVGVPTNIYNAASASGFAEGDSVTFAAEIHTPTADLRLVCRLLTFTAGGSLVASDSGSPVAIGSTPDTYETTFTVPATGAKIIAVFRFETTLGGKAPIGADIRLTDIRVEKKGYATSPTPEIDNDGDPTAGYAFTGTPHNSTSTRAASSASVPTAGHIAPGAGALAFRITPTIETGLEEIWGECGVKGAGTDHLRWGRDASTHPFVEWSANNAAYQRLTGSETLSAGTAYDIYLGHTGTVTSLAVDAGTLQTGTRAAVSGDFSTGDLTLEASAGGVIYQPFATFNRTLTAKEIATLNGKNNWTMKVLAGNPYRNFQLRPY